MQLVEGWQIFGSQPTWISSCFWLTWILPDSGDSAYWKWNKIVKDSERRSRDAGDILGLWPQEVNADCQTGAWSVSNPGPFTPHHRWPTESLNFHWFQDISSVVPQASLSARLHASVTHALQCTPNVLVKICSQHFSCEVWRSGRDREITRSIEVDRGRSRLNRFKENPWIWQGMLTNLTNC